MPKAKTAPGTAKKAAAKRTRKVAAGKVKAATPVVRKTRPRATTKSEVAAPLSKEAFVEPSISEAQSQVVASKFASAEKPLRKRRPRPTLPPSYGESHLLLLVRDPQTLFAAWDMAPSTVESLKARIGSRGFAVSTLTLRLTRAGGGATTIHLGKKARSRYLKIDGGPSFIAEIGFTTPAGRFELVARSAPCFVPMGLVGRPETVEAGRRAVLGYREARALARRGAIQQNQGAGARARNTQAGNDANSPAAAPARVLGGASDLYRR